MKPGSGRFPLVIASLLGAVVVVGAVVLGASLLREEPAAPITLERPTPGEVRADYLPDGTPVWVIGHEDGSVDVLSGFDPHVPSGLGKLLWWCETAGALDNPHHGSKWDEYGVRLGGPTPSGLPGYEVRALGGHVELGDVRPAPPLSAIPVGPPEHEREWCLGADADVVVHAFEGWEVWESPTAAVEGAPTGWILLEGRLAADAARRGVHLCSTNGCTDAVLAANVEVPPADMEFGPLVSGRFLAQVRDDVLVGVTRVVWLADPTAP